MGDGYATAKKAREEWARFHAWSIREQIPLRDEAAPPDWLVACYLWLRLTDPTSSTQQRTVKTKTAEQIADNLKRYARLQGWDASHLRGKATKITSLLAAADKLLPESQVTTVQARPITAVDTEASPAELDVLLDQLEQLAEQPAVSVWWACGWRAKLLTGIQGPMRAGETVTASISNLRRGETPDGTPVFQLTVPRSKWMHEPKELVFFCICGEEPNRRCPVHALIDWLTILADHGYQGDALFPATPRYHPLLPLPRQTGPIPLREDGALRRLACDIVGSQELWIFPTTAGLCEKVRSSFSVALRDTHW